MFKALFNIDNFFYFHKDNTSYLKIFSHDIEWRPKEYINHTGLVKSATIISEIIIYQDNQPKTLKQLKDFYVVELKMI